MRTTWSVREAQAQLPELIARATKNDEPCYIEDNGTPVAVLVSLREWQRQERSDDSAATVSAKRQEDCVLAYQKRMKQLGPDYWLPPNQHARLKELVEKEDADTPLIPAEQKELRQLLKRHEQFMVKRAAAMQVVQ